MSKIFGKIVFTLRIFFSCQIMDLEGKKTQKETVSKTKGIMKKKNCNVRASYKYFIEITGNNKSIKLFSPIPFNVTNITKRYIKIASG